MADTLDVHYLDEYIMKKDNLSVQVARACVAAKEKLHERGRDE